jgi:hypothetical protein
VGLAFLSRLDVGVYALAGALMVRDRRAVLLGFGVIAVPFVVFALATTSPGALFEQLIWYPIVGPREFRGLASPEAALGAPTSALLSLPLVILPRLAIALGIVGLAIHRAQHSVSPGANGLLGVVVFALLCQLQTLGRADFEHYAQAATPALLLFAIWFPEGRPTLARFAALATVTAACVVVGSIGHRLHADPSTYDRTLVETSAWVRAATDPDDPIFVGLTAHRFTVLNPLIVYYLADRRPGVHDTMFNPGVTNTDWGQTRMVADLDRTATPYLVLDRTMANVHESTENGGIPGSTLLDDYLAANYHTVCDVGAFVIEARNGLTRAAPPCPRIGDP